MLIQGYLDRARRAVAEAAQISPPCEISEISEISPLATGGPPNDDVSNHLRATLMLWGGPLGLPSLIEVGLGEGEPVWTEWLWLARPDQLAAAVEAAQSRGPMAHPDPRRRLVNWAIDARYPVITLEDGRSVGPGYEAWDAWIETADDPRVDMALRAMPWPIARQNPGAASSGPREIRSCREMG